MDISQSLNLDVLSGMDSPIHNLEGRIKLLSVIIIIVYCVYSTQLLVPIVLEIFLLILIYLAKLSYKDSFKRIAMLLPFAGFIIIFQPFIHGGNIIWQGSVSWIHITDEGLNWAILLTSRLIVSLTAIVLLSSTSPMNEIVQSLRKFGMPRDFAMILSIMVRFLFIFIEELQSIRVSQKSRNFDIYSKITPYKWRVKQVGYTIAMMFLKAYEKGERTYYTMLSRGLSDNSDMFNVKSIVGKSEIIYLGSLILIIISLQLILIFIPDSLGFLTKVLYT